MSQSKLLYNTAGDKTFNALVNLSMGIIIMATLYPVLYTLALSFSGVQPIMEGRVWLYPIEMTLSNYSAVFEDDSIIRAYGNTIFYTIAGTVYSMILTILGGYSLSRKDMTGRRFLTLLVTFTMLFNGGLIPTFLVVNNMGLFNTVWAMIIPMAVSQYNLIVMRTAMMAIPESLEESAKIDGANHWTILWRIFLPLCKPTIATLTLFYAVGKWNDFFRALIYLNDSQLFPVQLVIRSLLTGHVSAAKISSVDSGLRYTPMGFKAAVSIVTMVPILVLYPFLQRHFVKGVMIGAIKG